MHPKSPLSYGILGKKRAFSAEFKCKFEIFQNIHVFPDFDSQIIFILEHGGREGKWIQRTIITN